MTQKGIKYDTGKRPWDLLPWAEVGQIVDVLAHGAEKYTPGNWQHVQPARERYFSAAIRHMTDWFCGERMDKESGLHHLAHAGCCILFLLWHDRKE